MDPAPNLYLIFDKTTCDELETRDRIERVLRPILRSFVDGRSCMFKAEPSGVEGPLVHAEHNGPHRVVEELPSPHGGHDEA